MRWYAQIALLVLGTLTGAFVRWVTAGSIHYYICRVQRKASDRSLRKQPKDEGGVDLE